MTKWEGERHKLSRSSKIKKKIMILSIKNFKKDLTDKERKCSSKYKYETKCLPQSYQKWTFIVLSRTLTYSLHWVRENGKKSIFNGNPFDSVSFNVLCLLSGSFLWICSSLKLYKTFFTDYIKTTYLYVFVKHTRCKL